MLRTEFLPRRTTGAFPKWGRRMFSISAGWLVAWLLTALPLCAQVSRNVYWGYGDNVVERGVPSDADTPMAGAIYIPAEVSELYKGQEVRGLRVGLKAVATDLELFVVKELGGEPLAGRRVGRQTAGIVYQQFDTPYVPDGEPFYVGYSLKGTDAMGLTTVSHADGCWIKEGESEWKNAATDPALAYNALNIALWLFGSDLPFDVRIMNVENMVARPGESFTIKGRVDNMSAVALRNYTVSYTIDGGEARSARFETSMGFLSAYSFSIEAEGVAEAGHHVVRCELAEINDGSDDYAGNNALEAQLIVTGQDFARRMVVEEATGTWCGWCPRGTVALKEMYAKYPDTFIGIAVHDGDEMACTTYRPFFQMISSSRPACLINRDKSLGTEISTSDLEQAYRTVSATPAIAAVRLKAQWGEASSEMVNAEASVDFLDDHAAADYRLAFAVLEDGVTGYTQQNYYSGSTGAMGGWEYQPREVEADFDHVARGIYDFNGVEGSLPSEIKAGKTYTYRASLQLPEVQSAARLNLVALLLDAKTGEIMNAAKADIEASGTTGIASLGSDTSAPRFRMAGGMVVCDGATDSGTLEVYDAAGRKVANRHLPHGTYLVRFTDNAGRSTVGKVAF